MSSQLLSCEVILFRERSVKIPKKLFSPQKCQWFKHSVGFVTSSTICHSFANASYSSSMQHRAIQMVYCKYCHVHHGLSLTSFSEPPNVPKVNLWQTCNLWTVITPNALKISVANLVCILYASNATWSVLSVFPFDNFWKTNFPIEEMYGNYVPLRCPNAPTFAPRGEIFWPWLRPCRTSVHAKS